MEYKLMNDNINKESIIECKQNIIDFEQGIIDNHECIICFEGSTEEEKVEPIENFYIMPDCYCSYNVHSKCIKEWQHIQQQQQITNYDKTKFYCLKCNSQVLLKAKWEKESIEDSYRKNNLHVACVIISCIGGIVLLMLFVGLIIRS